MVSAFYDTGNRITELSYIALLGVSLQKMTAVIIIQRCFVLFCFYCCSFACNDTMSGCTEAQCLAVPGKFLSECKNTCNNCEGKPWDACSWKCKISYTDQLCFDSNLVKNCAQYASASLYALFPSMQEYCPKSCKICDEIANTSTTELPHPTANITGIFSTIDYITGSTQGCSDTTDNCTIESCHNKPGLYMTDTLQNDVRQLQR